MTMDLWTILTTPLGDLGKPDAVRKPGAALIIKAEDEYNMMDYTAIDGDFVEEVQEEVRPQKQKVSMMADKPPIPMKQLRDYMRYVSHFLSLNSAVDLLPLFAVGQHNTAKEIAESWAMYQAVLDH